MTTEEENASQRQRLLSFANVEVSVPALSLATAGFQWRPTDDNDASYWCHCCNLELKGFHPTHNPLRWHHATASSICPFLKDNKNHNVKDVGLAFPEKSSQSSDRLAEIITPNPDGESMEEGDPESNHSSGMPSQNPITMANNPEPAPDADEEAGLTDAEASNRRYKAYNQPSLLMPKAHIDSIKSLPSNITMDHTYERFRYATFALWPKRQIVSPVDLAASGFVYLGTEDTVQCVYCKVEISGWEADMVVSAVHTRRSPSCLFMQGAPSVRNVPDLTANLFDEATDPGPNDRPSELGIIMETSKYPEFAVETRRKASFLTWPASNQKLASEMIEHFFFYTGKGDTVCCFTCGVEMSNWESTEIVWRRHARQSPSCQLIVQEKGHDWAAQVVQEYGRYQEPEPEATINMVTTRMLRPRMDNPATQAVLQMTNPEYTREEIRNTLIHRIKFGGGDYMNRTTLIQAILKRREEQRQLDTVRRNIENEPPPPEIMSQPRRPAERTEQEEQATAAEPSADDQGAAAGAEASAAFLVEPEERPAAEPEPTRRRYHASSPFANPMELARVMKSQLTCKICMDATVGIAFLPCGHMVCCPACAPAMVQCPLCRQDVRGTVRAYLDKL